jgi:hypothetical protein
VQNSPDPSFDNFVADELRDIENPEDNLGEIPLNSYAKWTVTSPANLEVQNTYYEIYLKETLPAIASDVEAEFMGFWFHAVNRITLESYIMRASCNESIPVNYYFNILRNTSREHDQNVTVTCQGFVWSWSSASGITTVVPEGSNVRRLEDLVVDHFSTQSGDARALNDVVIPECTVPYIYQSMPMSACGVETYWMTGFTGFRWTPDHQPVGVSGIGNARSFDRPLGLETIVAYEQSGATMGVFFLPVLWFIGWMAFGAWDSRDKDHFYEAKRNALDSKRATIQYGPQYAAAANVGAAFLFAGADDSSTDSSKEAELEDKLKIPDLGLDECSTSSSPTGDIRGVFKAAPKLLHETSTLARFYHVMLREHHFLSMWSFSSIALPRHIRYLALWSHLLTILFTNSMLIVSLAKLSRDCSIHGSEAECIAPLEGATALQQQYSAVLSECDWLGQERYECTRSEIPYSFSFVVLFTCTALILATAINSFLWHFFWAGICPKQPRLEDIAWSSEYWLDVRTMELEEEAADKGIDSYNENDAHLTKLSEELDQYYYESETLYAKGTPQESLDLIRRAIKELHCLVHQPEKCSTPALGTKPDGNGDGSSAMLQKERVLAICRQLRMHEDGSPHPLSWYNTFRYGLARRHVEAKVERAVDESVSIIEELREFSHFEKDCRDIVLLQNFVIEQFDSLKKMALHRELMQFDNASSGSVSAVTWLVAWMILGSVNVIMLLFVGITVILSELPKTLVTAWMFLTMWSIFQETFFIIPSRLILFHVVLVKSTLPQLRAIYHTLTAVATQMNQDSDDISLSSLRKPIQPQFRTAHESHKGFVINKHLVPACRTARMRDTSDLAASVLLKQLSDTDWLRCRAHSEVQPHSFAKFTMLLPTLISYQSESAGHVTFEILCCVQWCLFLMFGYLLLKAAWVVFFCLAMLLLAYVSYLYLWRKPYMKKLRNRGASGKSSWKSRKFEIDGTPKSALRFLGPVNFTQHMVNKTGKLMRNSSGIADPRQQKVWRNMNHSHLLQGRVLTTHDIDAARSSYCAARAYDTDTLSTSVSSNIPPGVVKLQVQYCSTRQVLKWSGPDERAPSMGLGMMGQPRGSHRRLAQQQLADLYNLGYVPQAVENEWIGDFKFRLDLVKTRMAKSGSCQPVAHGDGPGTSTDYSSGSDSNSNSDSDSDSDSDSNSRPSGFSLGSLTKSSSAYGSHDSGSSSYSYSSTSSDYSYSDSEDSKSQSGSGSGSGSGFGSSSGSYSSSESKSDATSAVSSYASAFSGSPRPDSHSHSHSQHSKQSSARPRSEFSARSSSDSHTESCSDSYSDSFSVSGSGSGASSIGSLGSYTATLPFNDSLIDERSIAQSFLSRQSSAASGLFSESTRRRSTDSADSRTTVTGILSLASGSKTAISGVPKALTSMARQSTGARTQSLTNKATDSSALTDSQASLTKGEVSEPSSTLDSKSSRSLMKSAFTGSGTAGLLSHSRLSSERTAEHTLGNSSLYSPGDIESEASSRRSHKSSLWENSQSVSDEDNYSELRSLTGATRNSFPDGEQSGSSRIHERSSVSTSLTADCTK